MLRPIAAPLVVLAATSLALAACGPLQPPAWPARPPSAQGYPPPGSPTVPPAPTPTPAADADGYLPPPGSPPSQQIRLAESAFAGILESLQAAIDAGDGDWFGAHVGARKGLSVYGIEQFEGEGGTVVDAAGAAELAAAFFAAGARPRVQAYIEEPRPTSICLYVLTHRWQGDVSYPGVVDLGDGAPIGPQPPSTVPLDAAALHLCPDRDETWTLDAWVHGGYFALIARLSDGLPDASLIFVRP